MCAGEQRQDGLGPWQFPLSELIVFLLTGAFVFANVAWQWFAYFPETHTYAHTLLALGMWHTLAIASLPIAVRRWLSGTTFPKHPGEWLWTVLGATSFAKLFPPFFPLAQMSLGWMIAPALCGLAVWKLRSQRTWAIVFATLLTQNMWAVLRDCLAAPVRFVAAGDLMVVSLAAAVLIGVSLHDLRRGTSDNWSHWLGVGLWLVMAVTYFLTWVL